MNILLQDLRFGFRMLAKNPGLTAIAATTLALGIGLNTAMFSIVDTLVLRPLTVKHPEQIYTLSAQGKAGGNAFSFQDLRDIQRQSADLFSDVAGVQVLNSTGLTISAKSERIWTDFVTGNFFPMTGVRPALGRFILPSEGGVAGADPVLVLSYAFWKVHLGGDPEIVGKKASLNGRPVTIVGVAPNGFHPISTLIDTQAYMPLGMAVVDNQTNQNFLNDRQDKRLVLVARLKPGVREGQIKAAMNVVAKRMAGEYPVADNWSGMIAFPLPSTGPTSEPPNGLRIVAVLFLALPGVVLLLACVNVTNILLARATVRRGEIAVRAALGAKRSRLIWQLLAESLLLALLGCVGGMAVGWAAIRVISSLPVHMDFPIALNLHFDWRVFTYAMAAALLAGMVAGIAPAWRATGGDLGATMHASGRGVMVAGGNAFRKGLVIAQVAGSLMLLVVAGLFLRSLLKVQNADLGFDPQRVLNIDLVPGLAGYDQRQSYELVENLLRQARALPGVQSASLAATVPMGGNSMGSYIAVEGFAIPPGRQSPSAGYNIVSPAYFATMGIRLLRGRTLSDGDRQDSTRAAVINQDMAERFWAGKDPLGRRFTLEGEPDHPLEVVGVVRNSRTSELASTVGPFFYMAFAQKPIVPVTLQVRTYGAPEAMGPAATGLIRSLAPGLPLPGLQTMTDALDSPNGLWLFRLGAGLAAAMGILSVSLATLGVYGVVAHMAAQRTHEIGMRLALGASSGIILRTVLRQGMSIVAFGSILGVVMAFGVARLLSHLLVGVSSSDPTTFAGVACILVLVALAACYVPAHRAAKVDPMEALRCE